MPEATNFRCTRCGTRYGLERDRFGCDACAADVPANLELEYAQPPALDSPLGNGERGMWRYAAALPVDPADAVTLGEGGTPLVAMIRLGEELGIRGLYAKDESRNPTWSFKDRLASVAVSWARANGRPGIALSSSGNAGAAAAAYAARAGLPCIVFTTRQFPGTMQRFMRSFGAYVVAAPTAVDRWTLNRAVTTAWGWLPLSNVADPPIGSHPAGIEGHKTIAYEIAADLGAAPDAVVVPVAYGDSLAGIERGFAELLGAGLIAHTPRLIAVEAYPSLSQTLAAGAEGPVRVDGSGSQAHSVATPQGTYQALRALRASGGAAVAVTDAEALEAQRALREREGMLVELSAALPFAAVRRLAAAGELDTGARVVMLSTSSGLKDFEVTASQDELPLAEPDLADLARVLEEHYGFAA